MSNIKPCPFCGDDTAVEVCEGSTFRWRVAVCGNCGAQAGEARINTTNPDRATREANGRAAALREWNTRLEPAQSAGSGEWIAFADDRPEVGNLVQQYLGDAVLEHSNPPPWAFAEAVRWEGEGSKDAVASHWRYLAAPGSKPCPAEPTSWPRLRPSD